MHVLEAIDNMAETLGVQCVVVDAIDDDATRFYRKYGFEPLTDEPLTLFLPVASIPAELGAELTLNTDWNQE